MPDPAPVSAAISAPPAGSPAHAMLATLTGLPTAAGREGHVIAWVRRWVADRPGLRLRQDRFGNLMIKRVGVTSRRPIILAAHMDHPAFIVTGVDGADLLASFRGGVHTRFFDNTRVTVHAAAPSPGFSIERGERDEAGAGAGGTGGRIVAVEEGEGGRDQRVRVRLDAAASVPTGSIMRWELPGPRVEGDRLLAPACDDLAGVAAALAALERVAAAPAGDGTGATGSVAGDVAGGVAGDVRVLLTRAEEVGFIGAIAACHSGILPRRSRIVALENSKAFDESPIGGGPILRVGDRTSTFDPDLTYRLGRVADASAQTDGNTSFTWQRKLMAGGTCEASAYQAHGYTAACLCLPLGNYHNMNDAIGRIDSETISVADYDHLVTWLAAIASRLDADDATLGLRERLDTLYEARRAILDEQP
ncbi:MAG: hypothetical protein WD316_09925 [Phycisphaeraceae bacterium]